MGSNTPVKPLYYQAEKREPNANSVQWDVRASSFGKCSRYYTYL